MESTKETFNNLTSQLQKLFRENAAQETVIRKITAEIAKPCADTDGKIDNIKELLTTYYTREYLKHA